MPSLSRKKYFVYLLGLDPLHIFYVGKGSGNRPYMHAGEARANILTLKCAVIRFLRRNHRSYGVRIAHETDDETLAYWHEMKTITSYPPGSLTNLITGYRKPEYQLEVKADTGAFVGYLIHTKTGEEVAYLSARFEETVQRRAAVAYDNLVLPSYFKTIGYKIPSYFTKKV